MKALSCAWWQGLLFDMSSQEAFWGGNWPLLPCWSFAELRISLLSTLPCSTLGLSCNSRCFLCITTYINSCFSEVVFQVVNTGSMSYDKWSEASVLKSRGWVEESSPKAFCPGMQSSWDEAKGRFRIHGAGGSGHAQRVPSPDTLPTKPTIALLPR